MVTGSGREDSWRGSGCGNWHTLCSCYICRGSSWVAGFGFPRTAGRIEKISRVAMKNPTPSDGSSPLSRGGKSDFKALLLAILSDDRPRVRDLIKSDKLL